MATMGESRTACYLSAWGARRMTRLLSNKYLTFCMRLLLGVVFCYAAIDKIIHIDQFARAIYYYHILPGWAVNILAIFMPMLEMVAGLALILGIWPRGAVALIAAMLVMFIVALTIVYLRGIDINCGCFSTSDRGKSSAITLIWRDLLLLLACVQVFFFGKDFLSIHRMRP
jgi:uncharacterized membrane protein YphA (DoxX/SURF4 family)